MIHEEDFDILDLEEEVEDEHKFSAGRLFGVATVGAMISLGVYYIYQQLDPEKKARLKRQASGMIAEQIHTLTEVHDI